MSNKRKAVIFTLIAISLISGGLFFFTANSLSTNSSDHPIHVDHEATAAATDDIADSAINNPVIHHNQKNGFSNVLAKCFPDLVDKTDSPKKFIEHWKSLHPKNTEETDFIHYFYKNKEGVEIRAQLNYTQINNRPVCEFKLFRILSDGLPELIEIPQSDKHNPSATTLAQYIDFDSIFETQKKWFIRVSDTIQIEVEESNSVVTEFQLHEDGLIFRCHEGDCECKNKSQ